MVKVWIRSYVKMEPRHTFSDQLSIVFQEVNQLLFQQINFQTGEINMKIFVLILITFILSGCGRVQRWWAGTIGDGHEMCHKGVSYIQFTSGTSVKYNPDGSIATCED